MAELRATDPLAAEAVLELLTALETDSSHASDLLGHASGSDPIEGLATALSATDNTDAAPDEIGPFRIERVIGRGGMGVVYLAHQNNPDREVALKVLRDGAGTASLRSRFAREISALGRLEHPGIARIYEAGAARGPAGDTAYFAMEYIRGPRITDFAYESHLDIPAVVELLAKVADAVQHAHARGIIHRDLKPGNILIDHRPLPLAGEDHLRVTHAAAQPKILDFGVARLFDEGSEHTILTQQGLLVGTVAYMSPEQLAGDPEGIDIRVDVYSLGVILFELLAARLPFDVLNTSIAEAARIIRDEEPSPLTSTGGNGAAKRIDRDLQTIVAKAMAKNREMRYATAAALADDLRRYLRNEPILARRPTATYQLAKFARRHRTLVASAAAVAIAVTAGLVVSIVLFLREQEARSVAAKEAELTSAVRGYMIEGLLMSAAPERMGHEVKMLDVLAHAADGLHERFIDHPEIEAEVRSDLSAVYMKLGQYPESLVQAEEAITLLRGFLPPEHPKVVEAEFRRAELVGLTHQPEKSLELSTGAFARARVAYADQPALMLGAINRHGAALSRAGRHDDALAILREGVALSETLGSNDKTVELSVLSILNWTAASERAKGNKDALLPLATQIAERTNKLLGPAHEDSLAATSNLVNALIVAKQFDKAADVGATLPAMAEKILAPGHPGRGYCAMTASAALMRAGRFEESERFALQAYSAMVAAFGEFNWATDASVVHVRNVYSLWPGHSAQQRDWTLRNARLHLMGTSADQLEETVKALERICGQFQRPELTVSPAQLLKLVWEDRDRLAPPGHPRRAVFLAAVVAISERLGPADYVPEAISLAQEAMKTSDHPAVAQGLLDAARSRKSTDLTR
ncbi:MAG: serine/threonine-protein kinase [Phycisphaerales bacterium]